MNVERYQPAAQPDWDAFIRASRNGTFLFLRDYMDYHRDRFADHSLLIRDDAGGVAAVLPANTDGATLVTHGGLTFGGFVVGQVLKTPVFLEVFEAAASYCRDQGFTRWVYKTIPYIYHRGPAEEDRYALFLAGAALSRRDVLAVVERRTRLPYQQRRQRAVAKARKRGLTTQEDAAWPQFWEVLTDNLQLRHGVQPVHSLAEILLLQSRFPQNIRLFTCREGNELLAGVVVYESASVAHVQYIASTERGRQDGALDLVFDTLLQQIYAETPYFDFGISNEDAGRRLNGGLIEQKEGFGARAIVHDHYTLDLARWEPGTLLKALL